MYLPIQVLKLFKDSSLEITKFTRELEGKEYNACKFCLNNKYVIYRESKITPKKNGQFVTFWKRNIHGMTIPFSETDFVDFYIILVRKNTKAGLFIFPKQELIKQGVISSNVKLGKRGFRLYPSWDKASNKRSFETQKWQLRYFFHV